MPGLYDRYQLANSTTIPQYQGSAGRESIQVGQYMQGLYDQNLAGAMNINSGADELDTVLPQDKAAAEEVRSDVQNKLKSISERGDWENALPEVTVLGQHFANRAREIMAPQIAAQEYRTKTLTDKDKNLTPYQQEALMAMSIARYPGLQKDARGRLVGTFQGIIPSKNIDVNDWVDKKLKDFATQKGGTEVYSDTTGEWLTKNGVKYEKLSPGTIQHVLNAAMNNDEEFQGYMNQEGAIAGHYARGVRPELLPDTITGPDGKQQSNYLKTSAQALSTKYGIPFGDAYQKIIESEKKNDIINNARAYGETKYQKNDVFYTKEMTANPYTLEDYKKRINEVDPFGDLITGQGIDLGQKYGDASKFESKVKETNASLVSAQSYINAQKERVAKATGLSLDKIDDTQMQDWYAKNDPQELGRYQDNQSAVNSAKSTLSEINNIRDAATDAQVKKATGNQMTFAQLKTQAHDELSNIVKDGARIRLTREGGTNTLNTINNSNINDFDIVGKKASDFPGGKENIIVRNKVTGENFEIPGSEFGKHGVYMGPGAQAAEHRRDIRTQSYDNMLKLFKDVDWKKGYDEAVNGLRTNMVWMPLTNQGYNVDGSVKKSDYALRAEGIIRQGAASGAIKLKDQNDIDADDQDRLKAAISSNKFNLLGIGTDPKTGERRASLSVEVDASETKPEKRYKTIMVAADSNLWDKLASATKNEAGRNMTSTDPIKRAAGIKTFQFANALSSGSSYGMVAGALPGTSITVKSKDGTPKYRIMPNATGDVNNARVHQVYELDKDGKPTGKVNTINDDLHLSTYLDMLRQDGNIITQNE